MIIDFDLVRHAASDDNYAKILRTKWKLDEGSDGTVVCSRDDIEAWLANGTLEPVLTVDQFLSISHGKAYGTFSAPSSAPLSAPPSAHAEPFDANGGQWESHPAWPEYKGLTDSMKSALHHDFRTFLFVKRRGALAGLADTVGAQIESTQQERASAHRRAIIEDAVQDAPLVDADRFQAALARVQGNPNYPALQAKKMTRNR